MRRLCNALSVSLCVLVSLVAGAQNQAFAPTTTLTAETANNTSAADSFQSQSNGNVGAGNVSKIDLHTLLYPGSTTKIYAQLMPWFGGSGHMNVGYSSADPAQVRRQVEDMMSRGIDGVFIDWYGPGTSSDQATQAVKSAAEAHPGFSFSIMVDKGAIDNDSCSGCNPQQALAQQLQYIQQTYFSSPAYMHVGSAPVLSNFGIGPSYGIDWAAQRSSLSTPPIFLFQDNPGFSQAASGGSYSWIYPNMSDLGMAYLASFYATGISLPGETTVGATYKGFNDTLAGWGSGRVMAQGCGQTWLQTFSAVNSLYSASRPLSALQVVTWNDYEEGTEIESGIDNCVGVSAQAAGDSLQWSLSGAENTVDHYVVYLSRDSMNLMPLTEMAVGQHSLNVCAYAPEAGSYTLFVQAVGKASMRNHMSGPVAFTAQCSAAAGGDSTGGIRVSIAPLMLQVKNGIPASAQVNLSAVSGSFSNPIALSCPNLPAGLVCAFTPAVVAPGAAGASATLTVSMVSSASLGTRELPRRNAPRRTTLGFSLGVAGIAVAGIRRKRVAILLAGAVVGLLVLLSSCGGHSGSGTAAHAVSSAVGGSTYNVIVQGQSGSLNGTMPIAVTVH